MGKGRQATERAELLRARFDAGDHGAARRLAAEILADAASTEGERGAARELLDATAPDRAVAAAGIAGAAVAIAILVWLLVR